MHRLGSSASCRLWSCVRANRRRSNPRRIGPSPCPKLRSFDSPWAMDLPAGKRAADHRHGAGDRERRKALAGRDRERPQAGGDRRSIREGRRPGWPRRGRRPSGFRGQSAHLPELRGGGAERHQRRGARLWAPHSRPGAAAHRRLQGDLAPVAEGGRRRPFLASNRLRAGRIDVRIFGRPAENDAGAGPERRPRQDHPHDAGGPAHRRPPLHDGSPQRRSACRSLRTGGCGQRRWVRRAATS